MKSGVVGTVTCASEGARENRLAKTASTSMRITGLSFWSTACNRNAAGPVPCTPAPERAATLARSSSTLGTDSEIGTDSENGERHVDEPRRPPPVRGSGRRRRPEERHRGQPGDQDRL